MRKLTWLVLLFGLFGPILAARAQSEPGFVPYVPEEHYEDMADVPCPLGLNWGFYNYQSVVHQGGEFKTVWRSINQATPLPSHNWYEATPDRTILSVDGGLRWYDAQMRAHCYGTRGYYGLTLHVHPEATQGRTEIVQCTTNAITSPATEYGYDPYSPGWGEDDCSNTPGSSGGGSGGGGGNCAMEYIVVEISYDDGATWHTLWEGYANVCG